MTLYAIYQVRNASNQIMDVPLLYAFTNKKKLLEGFENVRQMKIFMVITREITKEKYKEFRDNHKLKELCKQDVYTRSPITCAKEKITFVGTWEELEMSVLHSDVIVQEAAKYTNPFATLLEKEYIDSLMTLGYFKFMGFKESSNPMNPFLMETTDCGFDIDDFKRDTRILNVDFDEFALLMYFYGYTFK